MNNTRQISALQPWKALYGSLAGPLTARARGLPGNAWILRQGHAAVGNLVFNGLRGAEFKAGPLNANIQRSPYGDYVMSSGDQRILTADSPSSSLNALEIDCGDTRYEAHVSFFRNKVEARLLDGEEVALLKGDVLGRRYAITLNPSPAEALPLAILLLYHTATFRRRAFLT